MLARYAAGICLAALVLAPPSTASAAGIETAVFDPPLFNGASAATGFAKARSTGASKVRLTLFWESAQPTSSSYNWGWFDKQVRAAAANGLEPFAEIIRAPGWAGGGADGTGWPDITALQSFAFAAASRYSGSFTPPGETSPLPRIRFWQVWGEPNRVYFLSPQFNASGTVIVAQHYRKMINAVAAGVKAVSADNRVVAGALSPLGRASSPAPLRFMRELFCLSGTLQRTCDLRSSPVRADAWAHHAYTLGGPLQTSRNRDNVQLGDLPRMRRFLAAARNLGHLSPSGSLGFWITEWSWDTSPPDRKAIPSGLHARWVSESIYRMWRNGVDVATWWRVHDEPLATSRYQSGFFTTDWRVKPSRRAFRFPTVAFRVSGGIKVWGRTPLGRAGQVGIQIRRNGVWRRLGRVSAGREGIFQKTFSTGIRSGSVRAWYGREWSAGFSLAVPRARAVDPFGCGGGISCG